MTMAHEGLDIIIDLVLCLDHPIDMTGVMHLDMTTQTIEMNMVILVITIEVPAHNTTIMGMTGQIVHLVNNSKVKAIARTITKVTTIIMVQMVIGKINIISAVGKARIGVFISMTTFLSRITTIKHQQPQSYGAMVRTNAKTTAKTLLLCLTFLAL